jgi:hypothetical protein
LCQGDILEAGDGSLGVVATLRSSTSIGMAWGEAGVSSSGGGGPSLLSQTITSFSDAGDVGRSGDVATGMGSTSTSIHPSIGFFMGTEIPVVIKSRCHTVKLFHSKNMSFGPFSLHY